MSPRTAALTQAKEAARARKARADHEAEDARRRRDAAELAAGTEFEVHRLARGEVRRAERDCEVAMGRAVLALLELDNTVERVAELTGQDAKEVRRLRALAAEAGSATPQAAPPAPRRSRATPTTETTPVPVVDAGAASASAPAAAGGPEPAGVTAPQ
ncbi:hypothetical protein F0L68_41090 [Solihabitans fulvus]|uniref:Uncharacterized protein n=1 Tax=Solihabitans fulvus TaxID=1892852 RepID=A0A5B2W2R6_9PSEU|nr:hypothetical protein [Solihabitans fulvus]KAA2245901.1 hypothetical protein F0L68_41090 [Solihabitans fulvus]